MKKRLLGFCLALCILAVGPAALAGGPAYQLYIGVTEVANSDQSGIAYWKAADSDLWEEASYVDYDFSVSYDEASETFTLTLNGAEIEDAAATESGIYCNTNLNLVLAEGTENSVSVSGGDNGCAIYVAGDLTIKGVGMLELSAEGSNIEGSSAVAIDAGGDIGITEGELIVVTDTGTDSSYGLCSHGNISITGGSLTVNNAQYGLCTPDYPGRAITISGGAVSIDAEVFGIRNDWGDISISGGRVVIDVNEDSSWPGGTCAIFTQADGDIFISGGTVLVNANDSGDYGIRTLQDDGAITVTGGAVYACGRESAVRVGQNEHSSYPFGNNDAVIIMTDGDTCTPTLLYSDNTAPVFDDDAPGVYAGGFPYGIDDWNTDPGTVYGDFSADGGSYTWSVQHSGEGEAATFELTLAGLDIRNYFLFGDTYGIYSAGDLNIVLAGNNTIGSKDDLPKQGVSCKKNLSISSESGGSLAINASFCGIRADESLFVSGSDTVLDITAGSTVGLDARNVSLFAADPRSYGIRTGDTATIEDTAVRIEKRGSYGDAVWAQNDLRILDADVSIIDWSNRDSAPDCGLHSHYGSVAIGGDATVTICSQSTGIRAAADVYLGYRWNSSKYISDGSPAVSINNVDRIAAIGSGFAAGDSGVMTVNGNAYISGGSLESAGRYHAFLLGGSGHVVDITAPSYRYKTNSAASYAPDTAYILSTDTPLPPFNMLYKYVEITPIPSSPPPSSGGYSPPSRTITVTETSSPLFSDASGVITAEANMDNAFSSSVEVRVRDTEADGFGLGTGAEVYPFDISLYIRGTNEKTQPALGYAVTIALPIPEKLLDQRQALSVVHKSGSGTVTTLASRLEQRNGVWYLVFEATEFSPYALVLRNLGAYDEAAGLPYFLKGESRVFIGFAAGGKYLAPPGKVVSVAPNPKLFSDIPGHWAAEYIGFVTERELFLGTGGDKFSPDTGMTRAMFATVIGRLYERSYGEIDTSVVNAFTDCSDNAYYAKYVVWAAENGIIEGYGNGHFGPQAQITREQMADMLYRFARFLGVLPSDSGTGLNYPDASGIAAYAKDAARYCQSTGVITGRNGGLFAPREAASRAEVAAIIERFIKTVVK